MSNTRLLDRVLGRGGLLVFILLCFGGCASNSQVETGEEEEYADPLYEDKLENINRKIFAFNDGFYKVILDPAAKGYLAVSPEPVENGVRNFFANLREIKNVVHDVLQWQWAQAANDSGRFLVNSTVGLLGLVDVASKAGMEKNDGEDLGQTLAVWGVPEGPYMVLPFLGPSSVRDASGIPPDWYLNPVIYLNPARDAYAVTALDLVHVKADLLDLEDLIMGDRYIFVRDAWRQRRAYLINGFEAEDDFGGDYDEFSDDYFEEE